MPAPVRSAENIYTGGSIGIPRNHGGWNADGNTSLTRFNAKDWPGRPLYTEAHLASYFATRAWVQAIRAHVADEALWARTMRLARAPALLAKDQKGALNISFASGHWQGQGEACNPSFSTLSCGDRNGPGGNLIDLRGAVIDYFEPVLVKSQMRRLFEQNIVRVQGDAPGPGLVVPSTQALQRATQFVRLQVTSMAEINNLDIPGDADLFTRARIGAQRYISGVVNARPRQAVANAPISSRPVTVSRPASSSASACSSVHSTCSVWVTSRRPASVSRTPRPCFSSSRRPTSRSSLASCCDTAEVVTCSESAAARIEPFSATACSARRRSTFNM